MQCQVKIILIYFESFSYINKVYIPSLNAKNRWGLGVTNHADITYVTFSACFRGCMVSIDLNIIVINAISLQENTFI